MTVTPLAVAHDLDAFRNAVRAWLPDAIPHDWKDHIRHEGERGYVEVQREWYAAQTQAGLATAHWPKDWGGADLSLAAQVILYEEMARADAPNTDMFTVSLYHMPATLFAYGTPDQRERYLEGARTGGDIWCQGFSEPGAGSDLASLRTRAERKGDVYVVNGQKIWSSYGVFADHCLLLARTNPDAPRKHDGISYLILDMKSPGLTIKPIRQITGEAEFAEVFFDDVEIPVENLIGAENDGWRIAQSTLTAERGLLIFENSERLAYSIQRDAVAHRELFERNPAKGQSFAAFYPRVRALKRMVAELLMQIEADPHGGSEIATYIKLYWATLLQDYTGFMARLTAMDAQVETEPLRCGGHTPEDYSYAFLKSYSWTIAGGSNEVMRNIIAERLLGLPR